MPSGPWVQRRSCSFAHESAMAIKTSRRCRTAAGTSTARQHSVRHHRGNPASPPRLHTPDPNPPRACRACNNRARECQHGGQGDRVRPNQDHRRGPQRARRLTSAEPKQCARGVARVGKRVGECASDGRPQSPAGSTRHRPNGRGFSAAGLTKTPKTACATQLQPNLRASNGIEQTLTCYRANVRTASPISVHANRGRISLYSFA
jgi:hypothetical protein